MASPLTPRTRLQTNAPYLSFTKDKETGLSVLLPDPSKKITIESCAEFLDYQFLGSRFGTGAGFRILHDLDGQIVVLSVGTDKVRNTFLFYFLFSSFLYNWRKIYPDVY